MKTNLSTLRVGRLLVIDCVSRRRGRWTSRWRCRCDCGKLVIYPALLLYKGYVDSCGCLDRDRLEALQTPKTE